MSRKADLIGLLLYFPNKKKRSLSFLTELRGYPDIFCFRTGLFLVGDERIVNCLYGFVSIRGVYKNGNLDFAG